MGKESVEIRANRAFRKFMKVLRNLRLTAFQEYGLTGERLFNTYG